jgi:hypothetical protein
MGKAFWMANNVLEQRFRKIGNQFELENIIFKQVLLITLQSLTKYV